MIHTSRLARRLIMTGIAALLLAWFGPWGSKHVMWWTADGHEIAGVVRGAVAVNETLLTPPQAYRNIPITPAEMSALSRQAQRKFADYYLGASLVGWRHIAHLALNPQALHRGKTSAWMVQWHVDWIHLSELTLLPGSTTATATASAEFRSTGGTIDRSDYTYHLVRSRIGWRIDREQSAYEPGYGP